MSIRHTLAWGARLEVAATFGEMGVDRGRQHEAEPTARDLDTYVSERAFDIDLRLVRPPPRRTSSSGGRLGSLSPL